MNDFSAPLTDDDLSAHLDGEGGPHVADRLASDPNARARLVELRSAADALRSASVVPLAPDLVDGLVDRALVASGSAQDPAGGPDDSTVVPLAERARRAQQWLVAAVVLVLVGAGLALVWSGTRDHGIDQTASSTGAAEREADPSAPERAQDAGGATAGAGDDTGGDTDDTGSNPTTPSSDASLGSGERALPLPDLGTFATSDELRSSLAAAFPADTTSTSASSGGAPITEVSVERCAGLLREVLPVTGDPSHTGVARVGDETVLVYEFTASPDHGSTTTAPTPGQPATTLTAAVRPAACDPLFVFQR